MRNAPRLAIALLLLGPVGFPPLALSGQDRDLTQEMTPQEMEIWEMEEAFWRYVKGGRVEDFRTLWHEDFASWPCQTPDPELPPGTPDWITEIRERNLSVTYEIEPKLVKRFGNVAVTQYTARFAYDYGGGENEFGDVLWKYTHTWMRVDNRWVIIGGMCGLLEWEEG